jgi:hypothetical protein
MAALLDRVTLETWGEIVDATVALAKAGDSQARTWLASYLVGKAQVEAPTPLDVIVERFSGEDNLVKKLAEPVIVQLKWRDEDDDAKDSIRAQVATELAERIEDK